MKAMWIIDTLLVVALIDCRRFVLDSCLLIGFRCPFLFSYHVSQNRELLKQCFKVCVLSLHRVSWVNMQSVIVVFSTILTS